MSVQFARREVLSVAGGAAVLMAAAMQKGAIAADAPPPAATPGKYEAAPLPFDPQKINGFSEKMLTSHHDNNYAGAVKKMGAIGGQLAGLDFDQAPGFLINGLKREELIAANSMVLHEIYFAQFGEANQPGKALSEAIARDFGSFARWRSEFVAMGKAEGGGSGWVILAYSPRDKRLRNCWAADHSMNLAGGDPVLVLDMYEHAYQMDFGAKAGDYVNAFMAVLNWRNADKLYDKRRIA
jgi:Fe-Mn family superoxide dismutase